MATLPPGDDQASEVERRYRSVRNRIERAAERSGRDPDSICLVGAGKMQPVDRLLAGYGAGLRCFGENRVQEAVVKAPRLPADTEWHFLGSLQSNKVRAAVPVFQCFHAIDRVRIARLLDQEASRLGLNPQGFLEVNLGSEPTKHGFLETDLLDSLNQLLGLESLHIVGLMAIPPFAQDAESMRPWLRRLRELRDMLLEQPGWQDCPGFLSMGMSHDLEVAVEEGATHVRVGTDLFGARISR